MGRAKKQRTIDRQELERLLDEQNRSRRDFFGRIADGVCRGTYHAIKTHGMGSDQKLQAIAQALGLPGAAAFLPVGIHGAKVRERRRARAWTEEELAARCRSGRGQLPPVVTAETIEAIEKGDVLPPDGSRELCRLLAAALECDFEDLAYDPLAIGPSQTVSELTGPLSERWVRRIFTAQHRQTGGITSGLDKSNATQPWSTAQALVGALQVPGVAARYGEEIGQGFRYLSRWRYPFGLSIEELSAEQEQGWALSETEVNPVPVTEITCWVLLAYVYALRSGVVPGPETRAYLAAEVEALLRRQCVLPDQRHPVGGFCPTAQVSDGNQRTYSTVMALWALVEVLSLISQKPERRHQWDNALAATALGAEWLAATRVKEFGWVPKPLGGKRTRYPGLTAQALFVLTLLRHSGLGIKLPVGYSSALNDFLGQAREFSRRWAYRDPAGDVSINTGDVWIISTPPYRLEGSEFYWAPWTLALVGLLLRAGYPGTKRVQESMQEQLTTLRDRLAMTAYQGLSKPAPGLFGTPEIGEALFGVSWLSTGDVKHASRPSRIETIYATHPLRAETILARLSLCKTLPGRVREADLAIDERTHVTDQNHPGGLSSVRELAREAGVVPGCRVLNAGCGLGGPARVLAEEFGALVDGVELTATRYHDAVQLTKLVGLDGRVSIRQGDFLTLDLPARHYDIVWGQAAWVHFPDLSMVFARCAEVLRSGKQVAVEEAYLRRQPRNSDDTRRLCDLEECWAAQLNELGVWVGSAQRQGFTLTCSADLTAIMWEDVLALRETAARRRAETVNANEVRSWNLAYQLIQDGILGYLRLVAQLSMPTREAHRLQ